MTLVQNHQPQLSGNKLWSICFIVLMIAGGCGPSKKISGPSDPETSERELPKVYNPTTGNYEPVEDPKSTIDTVQWTEIDTAEIIESTVPERTGMKNVYEIALLLPLDAGNLGPFENRIDPRTRRFINYYAGMKIAVDDLEERGVSLHLSVIDTEENPRVLESKLKDLRKSDLIIGPYRRDNVLITAEFASRYRLPLVSPWTPGIQLDEPNEYFIQMAPGLSAHAEATMDFIGSRYFQPKIYIVGRPHERDIGRFESYYTAHTKVNPDLPPIEQFIIDDASIDLNETIMEGVFQEDGKTVFIIPYYSRGDEDFINSFLRKLHAEHGEHEVVVFGLPQWVNFTRLNPNYLESLNTHITAVHFVDRSDPEVAEFAQRYYDRYSGLPESSAYEGYDLMQFYGKSLHRYGLDFLHNVTGKDTPEKWIRLEPVFPEGISSEMYDEPLFYENRGIRVLKFSGQAYRELDAQR